MRLRNFIAGALLAAGTAGGVQGAEVEFSFLGSPSDITSYFKDGVSLNVSAETTYVGFLTAPARVTQSSAYGLGVDSYLNPIDSSKQVDGWAVWNETLIFDFNPAVTLNAVEFRLIDAEGNGDDVRVSVNGDQNEYTFDLGVPGGPSTVQLMLSSLGLNGTQFRLSTVDWDDNFSVATMKIDYSANSSSGGAAVPLPSVASLGGMLLGALAFSRRRTRRD